MISIKDAKGTPYDAAKHFGVFGLKKLAEGQSKRISVNYSYFQPNGGAEMSASDNPFVHQFVNARPDGPVAFQYPSNPYGTELGL
jgi:hypothetical protein